MMGNKGCPGMIPYVATALFSMIETRYREGCAVTVEGSYIEIYQERIHGSAQPASPLSRHSDEILTLQRLPKQIC
jgi:hypothetical protein